MVKKMKIKEIGKIKNINQLNREYENNFPLLKKRIKEELKKYIYSYKFDNDLQEMKKVDVLQFYDNLVNYNRKIYDFIEGKFSEQQIRRFSDEVLIEDNEE